MKQCVQCRNDLPDTAVHCVYCGAKQQAALAKTVMGYPGMAAQVSSSAGSAAGRAGSQPPPQQVSAFDQTQPLDNDAFRDPPGGGAAPYGGRQPMGAGPHGAGPGAYGPPPGGPGGPYGPPSGGPY